MLGGDERGVRPVRVFSQTLSLILSSLTLTDSFVGRYRQSHSVANTRYRVRDPKVKLEQRSGRKDGGDGILSV